MVQENWQVYLSGEIHSDWRDHIKNGCSEKGLPVDIVTPITNHEPSDDCGVEILGHENNDFWKKSCFYCMNIAICTCVGTPGGPQGDPERDRETARGR